MSEKTDEEDESAADDVEDVENVEDALTPESLKKKPSAASDSEEKAEEEAKAEAIKEDGYDDFDQFVR